MESSPYVLIMVCSPEDSYSKSQGSDRMENAKKGAMYSISSRKFKRAGKWRSCVLSW